MISNFLIVEDSEAKLESIKALISREFLNAQIRIALSVSTAIDSLKADIPDVVVADMSLPTYDIDRRERGGTPRPFGGIEVFEYLDRFEILTPVVVVTSYPAFPDGENTLNLKQLTSRLRNEFPSNFLGTVYFDSAYSTWEQQLITLIKSLEKDKNGT
jgi:CheY-like chemotaxis protein